VSVGEQLTAARTRAGMTIEELSAATRIRPGLLIAMEADDFSRCGGNFYARGHVRAIAKVVGVDPAPLIRQFDDTEAAPEVDPTRREERADAKPPTLHPARPRWAVLLGAILVGLLGWGMVRLFTLPGDGEATAAKTTPAPAVVSSHATKPTPKPTAQSPTVTPTPRLLRVTVAATGTGSYVSLRNLRYERLFRGTLRSGSTQSLTYGGAIRVDLGDRENVRVYVNGRQVYPEGSRFLVTLSGKIQLKR